MSEKLQDTIRYLEELPHGSVGKRTAFILRRAVEYMDSGGSASVARSEHMRDLSSDPAPTERQVRAVIVDFVNYCALPMDLALYDKDLPL